MPEPRAPGRSPDLSIVIVNWNSRAFLERCLATVYAGQGDLALEVIVIDNASYDGSQAMVEQHFPAVRFIQGPDNLGFARANNAAAAGATGRHLLFLNPDTEVLDDALPRMVRYLDSDATAGAVGCRLLNTDGTLQTSCVQAYPTVVNQTLDSEWLRRLWPRSALWGVRALADDLAGPATVEAVSGACLLVRRDAFAAVGRFTEAYFMYAEDVDLCFKLQRAGLHNVYLGECRVIHHGGQSSGASNESQFGNVLMRESIARFLRLHRGVTSAVAYRVAMAGSALARLAALGTARLLGLGRGPTSAVQRGLRKWTSVLRWTVGAERWVRNPGARS